MITYERLISEYLRKEVLGMLNPEQLVSAFELAVSRHDDMELSDTQTNRIVENMNILRADLIARLKKSLG